MSFLVFFLPGFSLAFFWPSGLLSPYPIFHPLPTVSCPPSFLFFSFLFLNPLSLLQTLVRCNRGSDLLPVHDRINLGRVHDSHTFLILLMPF